MLACCGVSLLVAEQAEELPWYGQWFVGAGDAGELRADAIRTLERARQQSQLGETGLTNLACLYWAEGNMEKCGEITGSLPARDFASTGVLLDLLDGKTLDAEQRKGLDNEVRNWPRNWMAVFLAEKALELQGVDFEGAECLQNIIHERKQRFLVVSALLSVVSWAVLLGGVFCLVVLCRDGRANMRQGKETAARLGDGAPVSRLPRLWPLSLVVIVFAFSELVADWTSGLLWALVSDILLERVCWGVIVLLDTYWRTCAVLVMLFVFFVRARYVRRTFFKPVPKLMHWVFAAYAVAWLFGTLLFLLPYEWFPADPTVGHQWEEAGWSGLVSDLISAVILAPVCEEIVFRGFLFSALRNRLGLHAAVGISALVFTLIHFYGVADMISVGIFGVIMAYLYHLTRSLVPCVLCHALYNLIVTVWNWSLYRSPDDLWVLIR